MKGIQINANRKYKVVYNIDGRFPVYVEARDEYDAEMKAQQIFENISEEEVREQMYVDYDWQPALVEQTESIRDTYREG